jgi:hypothetical protein
LELSNSTHNLRRLGLSDGVPDGAGSDRLAEALVAWGSVETVAARVQSRRDAEDDQICIQVLSAIGQLPLDDLRDLAPALLG